MYKLMHVLGLWNSEAFNDALGSQLFKNPYGKEMRANSYWSVRIVEYPDKELEVARKGYLFQASGI